MRYRGIGRFPTLTLCRPNAATPGVSTPGILIVGYRPYAVLLEAVAHIAPHWKPLPQATDAEAYARYWGGATDRELQEALVPSEKPKEPVIG